MHVWLHIALVVAN